MSGANESEPLPSFLSHLRVSAMEVEPPRPVFGGGAPRGQLARSGEGREAPPVSRGSPGQAWTPGGLASRSRRQSRRSLALAPDRRVPARLAAARSGDRGRPQRRGGAGPAAVAVAVAAAEPFRSGNRASLPMR